MAPEQSTAVAAVVPGGFHAAAGADHDDRRPCRRLQARWRRGRGGRPDPSCCTSPARLCRWSP